MNIQSLGVIGAGVMGLGVAENLAQSGYNVCLIDISQSALERARQQIERNLRMYKLLNKGAAADGVLDRIVLSTDYEVLHAVDYVIENVTENWALKRPIYERIDRICPAHAIFGVNTSAIPITLVASATQRPGQVIGMHFMNPVPMKRTVELIRGFHTSEATVAAALELLHSMGKDGILVSDSPGFVSNRVLMLTINEAVFLVHEQVASAEDVDRIFRECFGHKMGPLETADLIGVDTILYSIEVLYESLNDSKYRPCPLLRKMVAAGLHGRKSGRGFYSYGSEGARLSAQAVQA